MDKFLAAISDVRILVAIVIVILILAAWLINQKVNTKKYRNSLEELEKRYNEIKSVPVSMKVTKAQALLGMSDTTSIKIEKTKTDYDSIQTGIKKISDSLAEAEDCILMGKLKKAGSIMSGIRSDLDKSDKNIQQLDSDLDNILQKETAQRQQVTNLKNRFRALKSQAQENASKMAFAWSNVEQKVSDTEKMFSTFEEWVYSNDYEKANGELGQIQNNMKEIEAMIDEIPPLVQDARGVIPSMAETLQHDYMRQKNRGVYLKHLNVEQNIQVLSTSLHDDMKKLKAGNLNGVAEHMLDYKDRLTQLDNAIKNEGVAYDSLRKLSRETEDMFTRATSNADYLKSMYESSSVKFGLENMKDQLDKDTDELARLNDLKPNVYSKVSNYQLPASSVLVSLKELNQGISTIDESLQSAREQVEAVSSDEERCKKQLIKLEIIMNQMEVKIRKYKLPNISENYREDMDRAQNYINRIEAMLRETPINLQGTVNLLQEALDFIYKLYNNVNNVVGTVDMVEKTIVFGNRYRSTYADVDSDLTRSELSFRNGEYTQALHTAISAIEKVHPNNYESVIKENAESAA